MRDTAPNTAALARRSALDRALSLVTDVRAGEGMTAVLMLLNIFVLLVCYSVIKTVREPLILLGGGAEVRSYAAAGQALLLMGFVPLYSWFSSRVDRARLILSVTAFFIVCIEAFAAAVSMRVPFVGVGFFIWVGIFNISLVAQFWSFANDIYRKDVATRLFPIIAVGMTAGAPLGSFVAGHLFRSGFAPQTILQISAALLVASALLYLAINGRETRHAEASRALDASDGFRLVLANPYLRLVALLVVLLNVVNTTGEYLVAKLLTVHVQELALANPAFNKQAFIGGFSGDYQFWVNVTALLLQTLVTSRLVKYKGLGGALLALPLIALGGYALIAGGAGFAMMRWIKTAENATDYSIMNTARQLLWIPTTREEKYKAKQAIDTFFVRGGDLLSAAVVYVGTSLLNLTVSEFALVNVVMTMAWLATAFRILKPSIAMPRVALKPAASLAALVALATFATPASAQETRQDALAAAKADKASNLHPYEPQGLERQIERVDALMFNPKAVYPFIGSVFEGGGLAVGPGVRGHFGDSGTINAFAAYSYRNYKAADVSVGLPAFADGRVNVTVNGHWLDAPSVTFFGAGPETTKADRAGYSMQTKSVGATARVQVAPVVTVGGGFDMLGTEAGPTHGALVSTIDPNYRKSRVFAEVDTRTSPDYSRKGGLYRIEVADYRQSNGDDFSFRRADAEVQQYIPLLRENWVIALRALATTTDGVNGGDVPYFLLPELGGTHMLRGYSAWRFRDRNRLLFTGEYRWTAGPFVDMSIFMDAGKVAPRLADLNLDGLETSRGFGVNFHTPSATVTRIEVARSHEGTSLIFSFSPTF